MKLNALNSLYKGQPCESLLRSISETLLSASSDARGARTVFDALSKYAAHVDRVIREEQMIGGNPGDGLRAFPSLPDAEKAEVFAATEAFCLMLQVHLKHKGKDASGGPCSFTMSYFEVFRELADKGIAIFDTKSAEEAETMNYLIFEQIEKTKEASANELFSGYAVSHGIRNPPENCAHPRGIALMDPRPEGLLHAPDEPAAEAARWVADLSWETLFSEEKRWHELAVRNSSACYVRCNGKVVACAPSIVDEVRGSAPDYIVLKYARSPWSEFENLKAVSKAADENAKEVPAFVINGVRDGYRVTGICPARISIEEGHHLLHIEQSVATLLVAPADGLPTWEEAALTIGNQ